MVCKDQTGKPVQQAGLAASPAGPALLSQHGLDHALDAGQPLIP